MRHLIVAAMLATLSLGDLQAAPAPYPHDRSVLTIHHGAGQRLTLTLAELQRLPQSSIRLRGPQGGSQEWLGVSLSHLLSLIAPRQPVHALRAEALNDYSVVIPGGDIQRYQPLVAYLRDGQFMAIGDYGPLQLVYPLDDYPELHQQSYYNRAIWQLSEIHVE